jgi:hypothetical protein
MMMSNFELQYTELGGIRSRVQGAGGGLADCASRLRRQVSELNGQSGFGIESVRASIGSSATAVSTLSNNSYTIAAFLSDLEKSVADNENKAYSALAGAVPAAEKLMDTIMSWTPGFAGMPWWGTFITSLVFPFLPGLVKIPGWVDEYIRPMFTPNLGSASTPVTSTDGAGRSTKLGELLRDAEIHTGTASSSSVEASSLGKLLEKPEKPSNPVVPQPELPHLETGIPDLDSDAYKRDILGLTKWFSKDNSYNSAKNYYPDNPEKWVPKMNCVYYARARAMQVNELTSYAAKSSGNELRANSIAHFSGHDVYIEDVIRDESGNPLQVVISEGNWATKPDGQIETISYDRFTRRGAVNSYTYFSD